MNSNNPLAAEPKREKDVACQDLSDAFLKFNLVVSIGPNVNDKDFFK